jgi:hypothetical protein
VHYLTPAQTINSVVREHAHQFSMTHPTVVTVVLHVLLERHRHVVMVIAPIYGPISKTVVHAIRMQVRFVPVSILLVVRVFAQIDSAIRTTAVYVAPYVEEASRSVVATIAKTAATIPTIVAHVVLFVHPVHPLAVYKSVPIRSPTATTVVPAVSSARWSLDRPFLIAVEVLVPTKISTSTIVDNVVQYVARLHPTVVEVSVPIHYSTKTIAVAVFLARVSCVVVVLPHVVPEPVSISIPIQTTVGSVVVYVRYPHPIAWQVYVWCSGTMDRCTFASKTVVCVYMLCFSFHIFTSTNIIKWSLTTHGTTQTCTIC